MKKIVIITTGGTIASTVDPITGRSLSGKQTGDELISKGNFDFKYPIDLEVISLFQFPSNKMGLHSLIELRNTINDIALRTDVDGVVITHGTDTLEETSYFLDLTINISKPVVLTGSQRIPSELGSDSYTNIRDSVYTAASDLMIGSGVNIVFNEKIFNPKYVSKYHKSNVDAFIGGNFGVIDKGDIYLLSHKISNSQSTIQLMDLPRVDIVKAYLDSPGDIIRFLADQEMCKGIVLEGLGRGHVPPSWLNDIEYAISKNKVVLITSSCNEGRTYPAYEFLGSVASLESLGVIGCSYLESKKARLLLSVALASNLTVDKNLFL